MRFLKTTVVLAGMVCAFVSCERRSMGVGELAIYVADEAHGLRKHHVRGGITLDLEYTPKALVVRELLGDLYSESARDSMLTVLAAYDYFKLTLMRNGAAVTNDLAADPQRYAAAQVYLASSIGEDIRLWQDGKSFEAFDFLYAQGNGMAKGSTVILVFKDALRADKEDFEVVFEDHFFGTGTSVFDFKTDAIVSLKY